MFRYYLLVFWNGAILESKMPVTFRAVQARVHGSGTIRNSMKEISRAWVTRRSDLTDGCLQVHRWVRRRAPHPYRAAARGGPAPDLYPAAAVPSGRCPPNELAETVPPRWPAPRLP
ncbi:hypothetical protein GCM10023074_42190 [Microbispora amethystogenes]|uniref:Uncharacterized protein n=1 Tax=Microbispora amethystogenes TaxID=1427754 RepID=A0ABQ4FDS4_9ACTN|nr:hypothetical protein Mam01_30620 [Microbispora amethystogenes]